MGVNLNLTPEPVIVRWRETHYAYVERIGYIPDLAPEAHQSLHLYRQQVMEHNEIHGSMALYRADQGIYRAAFKLGGPPSHLPEGIAHGFLGDCKYWKFVLTGPYEQLPEATTQASAIAASKKLTFGAGFFIENYLTNPLMTPPEENVTEILFPAA